jgi:transposase
MHATTVAVDLAKNVFELAVADAEWRIVERHRLNRARFARFFVHRPPCQVVMEACGSALTTGLGGSSPRATPCGSCPHTT